MYKFSGKNSVNSFCNSIRSNTIARALGGLQIRFFSVSNVLYYPEVKLLTDSERGSRPYAFTPTSESASIVSDKSMAEQLGINANVISEFPATSKVLHDAYPAWKNPMSTAIHNLPVPVNKASASVNKPSAQVDSPSINDFISKDILDKIQTNPNDLTIRSSNLFYELELDSHTQTAIDLTNSTSWAFEIAIISLIIAALSLFFSSAFESKRIILKNKLKNFFYGMMLLIYYVLRRCTVTKTFRKKRTLKIAECLVDFENCKLEYLGNIRALLTHLLSKNISNNPSEGALSDIKVAPEFEVLIDNISSSEYKLLKSYNYAYLQYTLYRLFHFKFEPKKSELTKLDERFLNDTFNIVISNKFRQIFVKLSVLKDCKYIVYESCDFDLQQSNLENLILSKNFISPRVILRLSRLISNLKD